MVPVTFLMGTTLDTDAKTDNRKGRPNYPAEFKRRLASEACLPGISVSTLARQHAINANMLFKWRRELRAGLFESTTPTLLPVIVKRDAMPTPAQHTAPPGTMIEVIIGDAVVRVHAGIDAALLKLVLQSLRS